MTNNLPIPPRSPVVAKYLDHYFKPAMTQGSGGMGRLIFALDATANASALTPVSRDGPFR
jgi:hypothetical protein